MSKPCIPRKICFLSIEEDSVTYSRVRIGKSLSDKFTVQNDLKRRCFITAAFQLCFGISYAINRVQENQKGLILIGTHQLCR
jgi:hypothetical protein